MSITTRRITAEVPDRSRIAEVQAEMTRSFDRHAIVESVSGSGQVIVFRVTFAGEQEVAPLVTDAANAGLYITPIEVRA